jgi:thiol-disulfide isomerase/thioredoxin
VSGPVTDRDVGAERGSGLSTLQIAALAVGVVVVVFIVLLATRDVQVNEPVDNSGERVPEFSGVSYDGQTFDMDAVLAANQDLPADQQRWTVVNFFASWCGPCRVEHPELTRFDTEGVDCPSTLVGVTITDSEDNVREFFDDLGGDWPVLVGDTSGIVVDFSVVAPPETIVVAPNGLIVAKFIGAVTYDALAEVIRC